MAAIYTSSRANGAAVDASLDKADAALPASGGTLIDYTESGSTLSIADDGDGTYSVTIPLDGKVYSVTLTQNVDIIYQLPVSGMGNAIVNFIQDATGNRTVDFPATTEWALSTPVTVAGAANIRTRMLFTQFSATGVDADGDIRGTA